MDNSIKSDVYVLSDVHIGDNSPTCWYQKSVHGPYLRKSLEHIEANAGTTRALVLLGDLFDLWTYPGQMLPATVSDIIAANPEVFATDGGTLTRVLDALNGEVYYLNGNHDLSVGASELSQIVSSRGFSPKHVADPFFSPRWTDNDTRAAVTFSHGHLFTMFNAPDMHTTWAPMPIGHFVTRMVASQWARDLKPGQTVADLPGQGAPNGIHMTDFLESLVGKKWNDFRSYRDISSLMLDWVAGATHWNTKDRFVMPDGTNPTLAEVKSVYRNLWSNWVGDHEFGSGQKIVGELSAFKSALADAQSRFLGWYAQRQMFIEGTRLMVMGHTHAPISGLDGSPVDYVNCGFECPSVPDMKKKHMTFARVDCDGATASLLRADGEADAPQILPEKAPRDEVVSKPFLDYSCVVTIENTGSTPAILESWKADHGYFAAPPPSRIEPGQTAMVWIVDKPGLEGSDGILVYSGVPHGKLEFRCPLLPSTKRKPWTAFNKASGGSRLVAKSGKAHQPWGKTGDVPKTGHPLYVKYTL